MVISEQVQHRKFSLEERREIATRIFPQEGPALVFDLNYQVEDLTVRDYLLRERGANSVHLDKIFSESGEWKLVDAHLFNLYDLPPQQVDSHMRAVTLDIGNLLQLHLDGQKEYGFNLHDASHTDYVTQTGLDLLSHSSYRDSKTLRRFVIAARGHDLGNVVSRSMHSTISALITQRIFPSVLDHPNAWKVISRAMDMHDEKVLHSVIDSWGPLSAEQVIVRLRELGPELLALVIADKVNIGPDRVPKNIGDGTVDDAVNDPHVEVNEYTKTKKIGLFSLERDRRTGKWIEVPDKRVFTWYMEFTPPKFGRLRGKVSESVRSLHNEGQPFLNGVDNLLYNIYHVRISLTALSAFALYPQLERFELVLKDRVSGERRFQPYYRVPPYEDTHEVALNEKIKLMAVQHGYTPPTNKRKGGARDYL